MRLDAWNLAVSATVLVVHALVFQRLLAVKLVHSVEHDNFPLNHLAGAFSCTVAVGPHGNKPIKFFCPLNFFSRGIKGIIAQPPVDRPEFRLPFGL